MQYLLVELFLIVLLISASKQLKKVQPQAHSLHDEGWPAGPCSCLRPSSVSTECIHTPFMRWLRQLKERCFLQSERLTTSVRREFLKWWNTSSGRGSDSPAWGEGSAISHAFMKHKGVTVAFKNSSRQLFYTIYQLFLVSIALKVVPLDQSAPECTDTWPY